MEGVKEGDAEDDDDEIPRSCLLSERATSCVHREGAFSIDVECIHSDQCASAGAVKFAVLSDEGARDIVVGQIFGEGTLIVADEEILP